MFKLMFVAGNPRLFYKVRNEEFKTKSKALEALEVVDKNEWRGWVLDVNGKVISQTETERFWSAE